MHRRGTRDRVQCWACGTGPGRVVILRGRDANGAVGAHAGGRAGLRAGGWFDLWVQVMEQWIIYIYGVAIHHLDPTVQPS
jgi:hypothetical protein